MRGSITLALAALLALCACQTATRSPTDETRLDPEFERGDVIDIAVLEPRVASPDAERLRQIFRQSLRGHLIGLKAFSVPRDSYVDRMIGGRDLTPQVIVEATGADAILSLDVTQWDTSFLYPKGRIYAGGTISLQGPRGVLWERSFRDFQVLSRSPSVTAANRVQVVDRMIDDLCAQLLETLPSKPMR
jgi:hypothetical protein